jgi:hypothetical protein
MSVQSLHLNSKYFDDKRKCGYNIQHGFQAIFWLNNDDHLHTRSAKKTQLKFPKFHCIVGINTLKNGFQETGFLITFYALRKHT